MKLAYLHYLCDSASGLNHVRQFASAARALGHSVNVYALNVSPGGTTSDGHPRRLRTRVKRSLARYLHEPKELVWNARYLGRELRLLRAARPDLLLVRDHSITASCVCVARMLNLPLVLEVNAPAIESNLYFDEYFHLPVVPEWLERLKLRRADSVTVVSSALKKFFVDRYGLPAEKLTVIPNGADVDAFQPGTHGDELIRKRVGRQVVIGFVGSFERFHGANLLGHMAATVGSARNTVGFLFVGDGPGIDDVRHRTRILGDRVHFMGKVDYRRIPALVASMDLCVMPESNFYGSPLKVLEWMAAGKPVVAPRYGPLEEIIDDGVEGLLFPQRDADALTRAVLRLVDDSALARALGLAGAVRVRSSLTWAHNAQSVMRACELAVDRHRRGRVELSN